MQEGLYEQLITKLISSKLESIDKQQFFIKETIGIEFNEEMLRHFCFIIMCWRRPVNMRNYPNFLNKSQILVHFLNIKVKRVQFFEKLNPFV